MDRSIARLLLPLWLRLAGYAVCPEGFGFVLSRSSLSAARACLTCRLARVSSRNGVWYMPLGFWLVGGLCSRTARMVFWGRFGVVGELSRISAATLLIVLAPRRHAREATTPAVVTAAGQESLKKANRLGWPERITLACFDKPHQSRDQQLRMRRARDFFLVAIDPPP